MNCDFSNCDYEPNEFSSEKIRKARKEYRCCECAEPIHRGQKYHFFSGFFDGDFFKARTCIACNNARNAMMPGGFVFGALWESVREVLRFIYDDEEAKQGDFNWLY